jgi:predicted nucleic acid-binding protein
VIVVADTSPLVVLISIGYPDLLRALFAQVIVPPEVMGELSAAHRSQAVRDFVNRIPAWLSVRTPVSPLTLPELHAGESAAISLACELHAEFLLIDERLGRETAMSRGLQITGTIGVLIMAAERDLVKLDEAFARIRQTDFWVSDHFLNTQLKQFLSKRDAP